MQLTGSTVAKFMTQTDFPFAKHVKLKGQGQFQVTRTILHDSVLRFYFFNLIFLVSSQQYLKPQQQSIPLTEQLQNVTLNKL